MANESDRSKVILFTTNAKTEDYKRSNHNDFATSAALKARKFNGWRMNSLTGSAELWIEGNLDLSIGADKLASDPNIIERTHAERFGLI